MAETKGVRVWALATFIIVAGTLTSLIETTDAFVGTCSDNAECNCTPQQEAESCSPASGAGGACIGGVCECNPGFGGENCDPTVPQGGACVEASECDPGLFCVDEVCCNQPCAGADASCTEPGREGTCVSLSAAVPVASQLGFALLVVVLAGIGAVTLLRRQVSR
jgi:hypothetical protein